MTTPAAEMPDAARRRALERMVMDYPVRLERLPDAMLADRDAEDGQPPTEIQAQP